MYTKQLKQNFLLMAQSCATLSGGNLPLFALTDIRTKTIGVKFTGQLDPTEFKLNTKTGKGSVGISCKKMKHAVNYTVFYGEGEYNAATWFQKTGGRKQIITVDLINGEFFNFIMVANGTDIQGKWANPKGCFVPQN